MPWDTRGDMRHNLKQKCPADVQGRVKWFVRISDVDRISLVIMPQELLGCNALLK